MYALTNPITHYVSAYSEVRGGPEYSYVFHNDPLFQEFLDHCNNLHAEENSTRYYYFNGRLIKKDYPLKIEKTLSQMKTPEERNRFIDIKRKRYLKKIRREIRKEEETIDFKYNLSMVTIVRDENDYLEEWIRYHIENMNFDHFYIYDNESKTSVKEYLESINFAYKDHCTIIDWKTSDWSQQDTLNDFLKKYGKETKWMITTDPDEYLVPQVENFDMRKFLKQREWYCGIHMHWIHYGANGQMKKTEGTDIERFPKDSGPQPLDPLGKHFIRPTRVLRFNDHVPQYAFAFSCLTYEEVKDILHLNHYITRSYEEWCKKMEKGTVNITHGRKFYDFFQYNPDMKEHIEKENEIPNWVQEYCPVKISFWKKVRLIIKTKIKKHFPKNKK